MLHSSAVAAKSFKEPATVLKGKLYAGKNQFSK
jgi:hypothetical protein